MVKCKYVGRFIYFQLRRYDIYKCKAIKRGRSRYVKSSGLFRSVEYTSSTSSTNVEAMTRWQTTSIVRDVVYERTRRAARKRMIKPQQAGTKTRLYERSVDRR